MPKCVIIAGPNGAGKTTFALKHLREIGIRHFINADMIAAGLSPLDPDAQQVAAARLFFLSSLRIVSPQEKTLRSRQRFPDAAISNGFSGYGAGAGRWN